MSTLISKPFRLQTTPGIHVPAIVYPPTPLHSSFHRRPSSFPCTLLQMRPHVNPHLGFRALCAMISGRYTVMRELGRGSFAHVLLATETAAPGHKVPALPLGMRLS